MQMAVACHHGRIQYVNWRRAEARSGTRSELFDLHKSLSFPKIRMEINRLLHSRCKKNKRVYDNIITYSQFSNKSRWEYWRFFDFQSCRPTLSF